MSELKLKINEYINNQVINNLCALDYYLETFSLDFEQLEKQITYSIKKNENVISLFAINDDDIILFAQKSQVKAIENFMNVYKKFANSRIENINNVINKFESENN